MHTSTHSRRIVQMTQFPGTEQLSFKKRAAEMMEHVKGRIDEINDLLHMMRDERARLEDELLNLKNMYKGLTYYAPQELPHE
jgi:predicted nuclease with TOPRIM domain